MTAHDESKLPYVLCTLNRQHYAVSCAYVREILMLPHVEAVAGVPSHVRGIVNIRGHVMQVVDLRMRLGMTSSRQELDELVALLEKREQDHRNWLKELLASVEEKRHFALTTDPHQCAFGQWYDAFKTEDRMLAAQLRKFDEPHKRIHAVAVAVQKLVDNGDIQAAMDQITWSQDHTLTELATLFDATRKLIREQHRDVGLAIQAGDLSMVMCVDQVDSIEALQRHEAGTDVVANLGAEVSGVALRKGRPEPILLLDPTLLFA